LKDNIAKLLRLDSLYIRKKLSKGLSVEGIEAYKLSTKNQTEERGGACSCFVDVGEVGGTMGAAIELIIDTEM